MAIFIDKDGNVVTYENQPEQERAMFPNLCDCQDLAAQIEILKNDIANKTDYIYNTAQGTIASFSDGADGAPIKSLIANINPVQDLHGYDAPWPAGGGKNKANVADYSENFTDAYYVSKPIGVTLEAGVTYTFSCDVNSTITPFIISVGVGDDAYVTDIALKNISDNGGIYITFTPNAEQLTNYTKLHVRIPRFGEPKTGTVSVSNIQLELGSTATDYAPYENVCPITGWTGAKISHSGADTSNPETLIITFQTEAGTVYGGSLDATTGVLTVTSGYIASYNGETLPSTWISDRDVYASGTTPTIGAEVVYELATPITYQLTPIEVRTLLGTNNIWADTGDVFVNYPCDLKLYIDKKIAEVE